MISLKSKNTSLQIIFGLTFKIGFNIWRFKRKGPIFSFFLQRHIPSLMYGKFQTIFYSQKKKSKIFDDVYAREVKIFYKRMKLRYEMCRW